MPNLNPGMLRIGARYTRPELAFLWGYKTHQAISRGVVTSRGATRIVLFVTRLKQAGLTQYNDLLSGDLLYWEGEEGHGSDSRIVSASHEGAEIHLLYREVHHSAFEYRGEIFLDSFEPRTSGPSRFVFRLLHDLSPSDDVAIYCSEFVAVSETERDALVRARMGQGEFREDLLRLWGGRCSVTGISIPTILRASHIKPWRLSSNEERLDPLNGLLLLPQYDSLFDRGLISFADNGAILRSGAIAAVDAQSLGIVPLARLRYTLPGHYPYLTFHREHVFAC